jgi:hypothetical protein
LYGGKGVDRPLGEETAADPILLVDRQEGAHGLPGAHLRQGHAERARDGRQAGGRTGPAPNLGRLGLDRRLRQLRLNVGAATEGTDVTS